MEEMNAASESINQMENEFQKAKWKFEANKKEAKKCLQRTVREVGRRNLEKVKKLHELVRQLENVSLKLFCC